MKSKVYYVYQFSLLFVAFACGSAEPEANTTFGPVRGVWLKTELGAEIAGFLGLPYAEPPVGELRFENPRPWSKNWTEFRNATTDGSMCLQPSDGDGILGDEDCLYLNVFTPTISRDENKTRDEFLPVMVFIHGGAFNRGSSHSYFFAPTYLLDHKVVLVTLNYRLNILGFFSTGNDVTPGNYGLKDIAVALGWVNRNVQAFGGDPNSVTLFGQSSGAAAAQLLSTSRATEGLFHKLITMSGTATAPWAFHSRDDIRNSSMYVAKLLGCDNSTDYYVDNYAGSGDEEDAGDGGEIEPAGNNQNATNEIDARIVECMKKANASDIVSQGYFFLWRRNPACIFGPTLEADADGAILTVHPEQSLKEGLYRDLPWITGVVEDEGLIKTADLFLNIHVRNELLKDYEKLLVPYVLELEKKIDNVTMVTEAIEDFYFNGDIRTYLEANVTQLAGDALLTWPIYDNLQKLAGKKKSDVYFYVFSYMGTFSSTFRMGVPLRFGTAHGDDLNYLFPYLNARFSDFELFNTLGDVTMIHVLSEMWVNFARTGKPSAILTTSWEPYQTNHRFMRLGNGSQTHQSMESDFLPNRMAFWAELVRNYSRPPEETRVLKEEDQSKADARKNKLAGAVLCLSILVQWVFLKSF